MASAAKIAASRANAQKSTGPRRAAGKARSRYNALRHGLSRPAIVDELAANRIEDLEREFFWDTAGDGARELASRAAEAQVDIERVQQVRVDLINQAADSIARRDGQQLTASERGALAFAKTAKILAACERFEKRARSRRNRALRKYKTLHDAEMRWLYSETVGPPVPKEACKKDREDLFNECTLLLDLGCVLKDFAKNGGASRVHKWNDAKGVRVAHVKFFCCFEGDLAYLTAKGRAWGEEIKQQIVVTRTRTKVGGTTWSLKCSETGKKVKFLYVVRGDRLFRSRHALALTYSSNKLARDARHLERARRLMRRLGGDEVSLDFDEPPRPKHMHRRTYWRLCDQIEDANSRFWGVDLRRTPEEIAERTMVEFGQELS